MGLAVSPRKIEPTSELGRRLLAFVAFKGHANLRAAAEASKALSPPGVGYQQLYDIAARDKDPRVSTLERIVEALGGTMAEFYGLDIRPKRK